MRAVTRIDEPMTVHAVPFLILIASGKKDSTMLNVVPSHITFSLYSSSRLCKQSLPTELRFRARFLQIKPLRYNPTLDPRCLRMSYIKKRNLGIFNFWSAWASCNAWVVTVGARDNRLEQRLKKHHVFKKIGAICFLRWALHLLRKSFDLGVLQVS